MKYEKPVLALLAPAVHAIQGSANKALDMFADSKQPATHAAYEADE
jgi:hypothetical protein